MSLRGRSPSPGDDAWAVSQLSADEAELWWRQSDVDRAHAVEVARSVIALGEPSGVDDEVVAAALLHDIGKIDAHLGVTGRVAAAVLVPVLPRRCWRHLGRFGRHLDYPERGAALLDEAGSSPFVVEWARQHHWRAGDRSVDQRRAELLAAADDAAG